MKRIFSILAAAAAIVLAAMTLSSCKDSVKSLKGTEWVCVDEEDGVEVNLVLAFTTKTACELRAEIPGLISETMMTGTYTYSNGAGTITFTEVDLEEMDSEDEDTIKIDFVVSGDVMIANAEGEAVTFNRRKK